MGKRMKRVSVQGPPSLARGRLGLTKETRNRTPARPLASMLRLLVYVIGLGSPPFQVKIERSETIGDLKIAILQEQWHRLKVNANELTLYKVKIKDGKGVEELARQALKEELEVASLVLSSVFQTNPPKKMINILAAVSSVQGTDAKDVSKQLVYTEPIREYEKIFIKVNKHGQFRETDIDLNKIHQERGGPCFVGDFERMLDSKPVLATNVRDWTIGCLGERIHDEYFTDQTVESQSDMDQWRYAERLEVTHIASIASFAWEEEWLQPAANPIKGHLADIIFFRHLTRIPKGEMITIQIDQDFPFHLVIECDVIQPGGIQLSKHSHRPDFLMSKSNLPRLLVQVNSTSTRKCPPDLVQMLLQGAAIVRFANAFVNMFRTEKNFVLCAIFIWDYGAACRYTLFQQPGRPEVFYTKKSFSLNSSVGRVHFARQLYNLLHKVQNEEDSDAWQETRKLEEAVNAMKAYATPTSHGWFSNIPSKCADLCTIAN